MALVLPQCSAALWWGCFLWNRGVLVAVAFPAWWGLEPHFSLTFPNYQAAEGCSSAFGRLWLWPSFSSFAFLKIPLLNLTTNLPVLLTWMWNQMELVQKCVWISVSEAIGPTPIKCLLWSAKCFKIPLGITAFNCLCEWTNKSQKVACLFQNGEDSKLLRDKQSDKNDTVLNLLPVTQTPEYCSWCLQYGNQENAGRNGSICHCHQPDVAWKNTWGLWKPGWQFSYNRLKFNFFSWVEGGILGRRSSFHGRNLYVIKYAVPV